MPPNSQSVLALTLSVDPTQTVVSELGERVIPAMVGKTSAIHKASTNKTPSAEQRVFILKGILEAFIILLFPMFKPPLHFSLDETLERILVPSSRMST